MNRCDRREQEREYAKFDKKLNKLNQSQREVANKVGREMANMYIKKLLNGLDRNISAAAILLGADSKKAYEISFLVGQLMGEDTYKVKEFEDQFEKEEDCQMAIRKINEDVKREVEKLLKEGVEKKTSIDTLVFKFPKLSKSMLTNTYQSVKEALQEQNKDQEEDSEIKDAMEYIFGEEKEVKKHIKETEIKETTVAEDAAGYLISQKGEIVGEIKTIDTKGLKVLEEKIIKIIKVKGANGYYEADTNKGVVLNNDDRSISFQTEEQLDEWVNEFKNVFAMVN